jgi:hypothetical protein
VIEQSTNSCTLTVCDGAGNTVSVPAEWGTFCGFQGEVCDGNGGCLPPQSGTCTDGTRDSLETDVDCGGPLGTCARCRDLEACQTASDCAPNALCVADQCQEPSCHNGAYDPASESDVDCGMTCASCAAGAHCYGHGDCVTNLCVGNACQACTTPADCPATSACVQATCTNGTCGTSFVPAGPIFVGCSMLRCDGAGGVGASIGAEWGVSCPFSPNGICDGGATFGFLSESQCVSPPPLFCSDGLKDGLETDVDCGGATTCARCRDGQACSATSDCAQDFTSASSFASCSGGACQVPACHNGVYDPASESDVDCGVLCAGCKSGLRCYTNADCLSHTCVAGTCM